MPNDAAMLHPADSLAQGVMLLGALEMALPTAVGDEGELAGLRALVAEIGGKPEEARPARRVSICNADAGSVMPKRLLSRLRQWFGLRGMKHEKDIRNYTS